MQSEQKICGNVLTSRRPRMWQSVFAFYHKMKGFCEMMDFTGKIPTGGIGKRCNELVMNCNGGKLF